jgi:hypothetical protein
MAGNSEAIVDVSRPVGVEKVLFPPKQSKFEDRKCPEN